MSPNNNERLLKEILANDQLPVLSHLAINLVQLASDENCSAQDLSEVIEKDPGLTTRLLKLAGSGFFMKPKPISSIRQAVVFLGFNKIRLMALCLSLRDTFPLGIKDGYDYGLFWKSSLYRGLLAQIFAEALNLKNLDTGEAFVGGLISEIGELMLYPTLTPELKNAFAKVSGFLEEKTDWEEKFIGINHRQVGSYVLGKWNFSESLVSSQVFFGKQAMDKDSSILDKVIELARRATEIVFLKTRNLFEIFDLADELLGLEAEVVNAVLVDIFSRVELLAEQLQIKIDPQQDLMEVMERANQALMEMNNSLDSTLQVLLKDINEHIHSLTPVMKKMTHSRRDLLQNTLDAVAHEIRNPLTSIGGFAKRLVHEIKEDNSGKHYAEIIVKESVRLELILKEIMEYSRTYEPEFKENDLIDTIEKVLCDLENKFREKNIQVIREFGLESLPVHMDNEGIIKAMRYLLLNSIEMIDKPHGIVTISVQPLWQIKQFAIAISDNGRSMLDIQRDGLLDTQFSSKTFGEGLGLPLAKKIIEAHSGHLELERTEGYGNVVKLVFPVSKVMAS